MTELICELSGRLGRPTPHSNRDLDPELSVYDGDLDPELSVYERDLSELELELSDLDREVEEEQVLVVNIQRETHTASATDSLSSPGSRM